MKTASTNPATTQPEPLCRMTIKRGEDVEFSPELKRLLDRGSEKPHTKQPLNQDESAAPGVRFDVD